MRREGTRNLLAAANAAGASRFVAQSIAWQLSGEAGAAVAELERLVLAAGGVVLRYGRLYGPGTYYEVHLRSLGSHVSGWCSPPRGRVRAADSGGPRRRVSLVVSSRAWCAGCAL